MQYIFFIIQSPIYLQVKSGGPHRRCLVVSIGPDDVLNFLEGGDCIRTDGVPGLRAVCVPAPIVGGHTLSRWLRGVFEADDACQDHGCPEVGEEEEEEEGVTIVELVVDPKPIL